MWAPQLAVNRYDLIFNDSFIQQHQQQQQLLLLLLPRPEAEVNITFDFFCKSLCQPKLKSITVLLYDFVFDFLCKISTFTFAK